MSDTKQIFKITYPNSGSNSRYIETTLSLDEVADIVTGLEFYLEDCTKYGMNLCITEDMATYLLCNFFGCCVVEREEIWRSEWYDSDIEDISEIMHIDLYHEREQRCGEDYSKYESYIESIKDSKFVNALCVYFSDDIAFKKQWNEGVSMLSVEEIMQKY